MEFKKDTSFVSGRIKSFSFAYKGAYKLITTEHSIMAQLALGLIVAIAGFYFDISREEWIMQIMATGMVLAVEGLNTAVEKIADFVHPGYDKSIGFIKDIAAGAVFFAATAALIVGAIIYWPYIF